MSYDSTTTSTNLLTLNNKPFPSSTLPPPPPPPLSSSSSSSSSVPDSKQLSKLVLRSALQKANAAVQCDSTNDVLGAINAYNEAITLLERVLATVDKENDRRRLQEIHDSYSERIRLLSTITSDVLFYQQPKTTNNRQVMTSSSSIDSLLNDTGKVISPSPSTFSNRYISQKEKLSIPPSSLPPPLPLPQIPTQLQISKSTPTKGTHNNNKYDDFDLEKDELHLLGQHEPMIPTPASNNRDSTSSMDSSRSSIDSMTTYEQPSMALPSLASSATPIPTTSSSVFRTRTSSLPKSTPPIMQRSCSMSTAENLLVDDTEEQQQQQQSISPPPPPPTLIINRPILSRPSVGGSLGSIRKKAANRLSMDGFIRNKSASNGTPIYGLLLRDEIQSCATEEEYDDDDDFMETTGHLKLLLALEKSMLEGAHITQKLYIPKNLWQQPNIRLSSMDIKVSACESLMHDIARLENWSYLDDLISSARLLDNFETSVDLLQTSLSKKLKRDSQQQQNSESNSPNSLTSSNVITGGVGGGTSVIYNNSRDSMPTVGRVESGKKTQSFMSWGTKLTKSVERMNAFSLTKTEDQYRNYIEALQKLFLKIHILENWLNYYNIEKRKSRQPQHDVLIMKLVKICTVINTVVGGFVVRDITILLAKWLKRGGSWVNE